MKKIVFGVSGSIAAFKSPMLLRLFTKDQWAVQVLMTASAQNFVSPLVLSTLSGNPVWGGFAKENSWNNYVQCMAEADALLIAPASANTIAKLYAGICDNVIHACFMEAECPVFIAPAMEEKMWCHPTNQRNIEYLKTLGVNIIMPEKGALASGKEGMGRMAELETIFETVKKAV